jgi:hypothetical protein
MHLKIVKVFIETQSETSRQERSEQQLIMPQNKFEIALFLLIMITHCNPSY